jgi:hypothetical protein
MGRLSNVELKMNSSDRHESPARIVALIAGPHNLGATGQTVFLKRLGQPNAGWEQPTLQGPPHPGVTRATVASNQLGEPALEEIVVEALPR